jgi:hypothetical protein
MAEWRGRIDLNLPGSKPKPPAATPASPPQPASASIPLPMSMVSPMPPPPAGIQEPTMSPALQALELSSAPMQERGEGWGMELPTQMNVPGGRMLPASGRALLELTRARGGRAY